MKKKGKTNEKTQKNGDGTAGNGKKRQTNGSRGEDLS